MITAWILYAIVVGALFGAGGLALEKMVRAHGLASRWIWAAAIIISFTFPLGHWAWRQVPNEVPVVSMPEQATAVQADPTPIFFPLEPTTVEVPQESVFRLLDGPILLAWALATFVLLCFSVLLLLRTHRLRGNWREGRIGDQAVLYSDEWGPAVVGFICPQVVLPRWCRDIDERAVRFILDHELEHVRAGDLRLMLVAGILPVLFPWHLPLWWQLSRLRTAVEGDCDLRVLRKHPGQMKPYVDLLLQVGELAPGRRPIAAMLSEPYETLKRRIKIMTMPFPKRPWITGGLLAGAGIFMVGLACWAPGPTDAEDGNPEAQVEQASLEAEAGAPGERTVPTFTPYTVSPDVRNREEVAAALQGGYPAELREAGIGGTVVVWFFVDEQGTVQNVQVNESSGRGELDQTALSIASMIEFTPALNRDRGTPVWVSLPIAFGEESAQEASEAAAAARRAGRSGIARPSEGDPGSEGAAVRDPNAVGQISGTARDAASGEPLQYVQVWVYGINYGTLSNEEGRFLIEHVPAGDHAVEAVFMGYARARESARVVRDGRVTVDFRLHPQAVALTPFVVPGGAGDPG
ncbi:MAG: TonB family protein, partial [Gemmatimonadota bacterium]